MWEMLEEFNAFMQSGTLTEIVLMLVITLAAGPALVFVHELGHALAAKARGLEVDELVVGDTPDVIVRAGRFTMRLGRHLGKGDVRGYVRSGDANTTPVDVLVVALAGPAANVLAVVALLVASVAVDGPGEVTFALLAVSSAAMAVGNLIPSGDDATLPSDGRVAQLAWAARREPSDPNAATSVPPPAPRASGRRGRRR